MAARCARGHTGVTPRKSFGPCSRASLKPRCELSRGLAVGVTRPGACKDVGTKGTPYQTGVLLVQMVKSVSAVPAEVAAACRTARGSCPGPHAWLSLTRGALPTPRGGCPLGLTGRAARRCSLHRPARLETSLWTQRGEGETSVSRPFPCLLT